MAAQLARGRTGGQTPEGTLLPKETCWGMAIRQHTKEAKASGEEKEGANMNPEFESRF